MSFAIVNNTQATGVDELLNNISNPTADSFATWCGLTDNHAADNFSEAERTQFLGGHLGYLQRTPRDYKMKVHSEFCAKYLPKIVEVWRNDDRAISGSMTVINAFVFNPYFVRFVRTPAGQGMAIIQASRIAALDAATEAKLNVDQIGELVQFLSTLLVLQGVDGISDEDKQKVKDQCKAWMRKYRRTGRTAENGSERCLDLLNSSGGSLGREYAAMRNMLDGFVDKCGLDSCNVRRREGDGGALSQCGRCRTTVYCSTEHQRAHWSTHKKLCFAPAF